MKNQSIIASNEFNEFNLATVKNWLFAEYEQTGDGFYCNWNVIEKAIGRGDHLFFKLEGDVIGFMVWNFYDIQVDLDIMEINSRFRGQGFGRQCFNLALDHFIGIGAKVVKLFCAPANSEPFWKKLGFTAYPDTRFSMPKLTYYRPIIEVSQPSKHSDMCNRIELWDVEPYQARNHNPAWIWDLHKEAGKLQLPILHPCDYDWNIRWVRNGAVYKESKVKYMGSENSPIDRGDFLYISEINENHIA